MAGKRYKVLTGLNYVPQDAADEVRVEVGDVVDDLPERSVKWLLHDGHIEEVHARQVRET